MNQTKNLSLMGILLATIIICSWIFIPMTIPITLQTFAIFLTVRILGTWKSFLTVFSYILLGVIGLPVFSGFKSGIVAITGPTGGYILGFLFTVIVTGKILDQFEHSKPWRIFSMILGLFVCYLFGTLWFVKFYTKSPMSFFKAFSLCVLPFIIPDILKIFLADYLGSILKKFLKGRYYES
ncbi:MAG: biotin transporter BioY [Lagierella massiliensis]|nr:biotin transporter BioY [Lagierella massiliensis]